MDLKCKIAGFGIRIIRKTEIVASIICSNKIFTAY